MSDDVSVREWLYDPQHPLRSPLLGKFFSRTVCALGHSVVVMEYEPWDEDWLACSVCGARFLPASALDGGESDE